MVSLIIVLTKQHKACFDCFITYGTYFLVTNINQTLI